jgi:hypothetical protein
MPKVIGYLEGSDSLWLTRLLLQGHDTMPLSNGYDGHGMNIQQLSPQHKISAVICYMHKLVPPRHLSVTVKEILHATKVYEIPVLIACPKDAFAAARERLGEIPPNAQLLDPAEMLETLQGLLK